MAKTKFGFWAYAICVILIATSIFAVIGMVKIIKKRSTTYGDGFDIEFIYNQPLFHYASSNLIFTPKNNIYTARVEQLPSSEFDGEEYIYDLMFCDYICEEIEQGAGYIRGKTTKEFNNNVGEISCKTTINVEILFYDNRKSVLTVTCNGNADIMSYWSGYFNNYGVRVDVIPRGKINEKN